MTLRATVSTVDRRFAASFGFEGDGEPVVECAGTLREPSACAAELLVGGVAAVCALAGRRCPDGLQVRATSSIRGNDIELAVAATIAAAVAANVLLGLGLDDATVARVSEGVVRGAIGGADAVAVPAAVVREYRVSVRESCPDD